MTDPSPGLTPTVPPSRAASLRCRYEINDIEAKYYADSEDAYDMRKRRPSVDIPTAPWPIAFTHLTSALPGGSPLHEHLHEHFPEHLQQHLLLKQS